MSVEQVFPLPCHQESHSVQMTQSKTLKFLSQVINSCWQTKESSSRGFWYEEESIILPMGEWTGPCNRKYWYALFETTRGLIVHEYDVGIVVAHCPSGVDGKL
jgi:hypothetical protein